MIRTKEKSLSVLIKEADEAFSEYVRVRDAHPFNGLVFCFICGVAIPWRSSQGMHYIDRDQMPTRFDEVNVNAGCQACNMMDDDHGDKYRLRIALIFGVAQLERLESRSQNLQKFVRPELIEMIGHYKGKTQELRKQKHI